MTRSRWEVLDGYRVQPYVLEPGAGVAAVRPSTELPGWDTARLLLPALVWAGHDEVEAAFERAWELAWQHLRPAAGGPFAAPYLDSAFNGNVFLWDAAFAQRFMVYARRVLDAHLLDPFFAAQTDDGWMCRTMTPAADRVWERHDPSSTGPNVLAWIELECALRTGEVDRLAHVLPALLAYHRWMRRYRTWPSGGYWSTGWGCGMDGLPRLPDGVDPNLEHGRVTWVDATLQALLSAKSLLAIADLTGCATDLADVRLELIALEKLVTTSLWDEKAQAFFDLHPDGSAAGALHVGTFWALLALDLAPDRQAALLEHLVHPDSFGRPFPVPALARRDPSYREDGGYWRGGVWTPTTVMVLDGLRAVGAGALAHQLGRRHVELVSEVVATTGTIWENYRPEVAAPGFEARPDFVGWGGASVITAGIEQLLGIDARGEALHWDVRLLEQHGVLRLPVGAVATVDLLVAAREDAAHEPVVTVRSDAPVRIDLTWPGGSRSFDVQPEARLAH